MEKLELPDVTLGEKEKDHSCLMIQKSVLEEYRTKGGQRLELQFRENIDRMDLYILGYDLDNKLIMEKKLDDFNGDCEVKKFKTPRYGVFYHDVQEQSLHDLIGNGTSEDWYLKPDGYKYKGKNYVGYLISNRTNFSLLVTRINPCPPCNL